MADFNPGCHNYELPQGAGMNREQVSRSLLMIGVCATFHSLDANAAIV